MSPQVEERIRKIGERIKKEYRAERVILFGSYATGEATEDSDIDLLIVKETSDRFIDRWVKVRELIADPKRRIPVEPIVMTSEELDRRIARGDQFFRRIVADGKLLYAA